MLLPTILRPQYQTIIGPTLSADSATWDGFCLVVSYDSTLFTKTGSRVRVSVTPSLTGASLVVAAAYIGMAGTAPSFDGNQVQLLRESDGGSGFTLTAAGSNVALIANFRPIIGSTLLVAFGITSGDIRRNTALSTSYTSYSKAGDAANAGTTTKSGYTLVGSRSDIIAKIEVLN